MIQIADKATPVWPVHPRPLPDELLSSWMTRLARANQMKVYSFYSLYFGKSHAVWNRDIDKLAPDWLMDGLSSWTGLGRTEVEQTTLRSYEGLIYEHHNPYGNTKWILPAGVYHRTRRHHGLVYCPLCLFEDPEPYFRKSWRLSFNTVCERHGSMMLDGCPKCSAPVAYFRRDLGHRRTSMVDSMVLCHQCGADLRRGPAMDPPAPDGETLAQLRALITFRDLGWWFCGHSNINYSPAFFDVLHHLASYLTSAFGRRLHAEIERQIGRPASAGRTFKRMGFDHRPMEERHHLLSDAMWLLLEWPDRFTMNCHAARLSATQITRCEPMPYWFVHSLCEPMPVHLAGMGSH